MLFTVYLFQGDTIPPEIIMKYQIQLSSSAVYIICQYDKREKERERKSTHALCATCNCPFSQEKAFNNVITSTIWLTCLKTFYIQMKDKYMTKHKCDACEYEATQSFAQTSKLFKVTVTTDSMFVMAHFFFFSCACGSIPILPYYLVSEEEKS